MDRMATPARIFCLLAACLLLAGCNPEIRATALHIGDSLMSGAVQKIQQTETAQDSAVLPVFSAVPGSGLMDNSYWIPRLSNIQARMKLDIVFISLGSNDAHGDRKGFAGADAIKAEIDDLLANISQGTLVYWVLPHRSIAKAWNIADQYSIVTQAILQARDSGDWPNLRVLDFDSWVEGQQKKMSTLLTPDGVHLNDDGNSEWASMIQHTIDVEFPVE